MKKMNKAEMMSRYQFVIIQEGCHLRTEMYEKNVSFKDINFVERFFSRSSSFPPSVVRMATEEEIMEYLSK